MHHMMILMKLRIHLMQPMVILMKPILVRCLVFGFATSTNFLLSAMQAPTSSALYIAFLVHPPITAELRSCILWIQLQKYMVIVMLLC